MKEARAKKNVKDRDLNPIISKTQGGIDCTKVNKLTAAISLCLIFIVFSILFYFNSTGVVFAETIEKNHLEYPDAPLEVVEAFINTGLKVNIDEKKMRLCDEYLNAQYIYLPDQNDINSNRKKNIFDVGEPWGPCWNKFHIVTGFEIKEVKQGKNKAIIKVVYKRLGWIWDKPKYIEKCKTAATAKVEESSRENQNKEKNKRSSKKESVWDKEDCKFLYITNDVHEVVYHLAKPAKYWRIINCYEPHIPVSMAIKTLECAIRERPSVSTTYPTAEQSIAIKQDIEVLKKYLDK